MENTPNTINFKKIYAAYMVVVGILGQLLFYAQAYKIFTSKCATDLSIIGFTAGLISVTSWLIYGIILRDRPLIIANVVACVGAIAVIIGIIIYR